MAGIITFSRSSAVQKLLPVIQRRLVSTSNKKYDTVTAESIKSEQKSETQKSWVSYGFDKKSKSADRNVLHSVMFLTITLCFVVGGVNWIYSPDFSLRDWSQREAYLQLYRREKDGLPPIDPNYIDPSKFVLPSDEELEDTEIII